jgi:hypothetical protein
MTGTTIRRRPGEGILLVLGGGALGGLLFTMVALPFCEDAVYRHREILAWHEVPMAAGFLLTLLFHLAHPVWQWIQPRRRGGRAPAAALALGAVVLVLLGADKVLLDEIGREMRLGWETGEEKAILHVCLGVQALATLLALLLVRRGSSPAFAEPRRQGGL